MQKKKDNYFVRVNADFLFDKVKLYKSRYTPWIYTYLKLEKNYYLDHHLKKTFNINTISISGLLGIDRATTHRCLNELIQIGLVEKYGRNSYKINSEKNIIPGKSPFIKIYKNLFINIFENGGNVDDALIYFYMIQNNRHYAFEYNFLESELTQSRISRDLKIGQRKVKASIEKLKTMGLIAIDDDNVIHTRSPKSDWNLKYKNKVTPKLGRITVNTNNDYSQQPIDIDELINPIKKEPEQFVYFWKKTRDGKIEAPVIKSKNHGFVLDSTRSRNADGKPMTEEEWEMQNEKYKSLNNQKNNYDYDANIYVQNTN